MLRQRLKNWALGRRRRDRTLNNVSPQDIVNAAAAHPQRKVFRWRCILTGNGPQDGLWGNRFNPIQTMLADRDGRGSRPPGIVGLRYADDMVSMPLQCGTQWMRWPISSAKKMWNGYDARLVDSNGRKKRYRKRQRIKCRAGRAPRGGPAQGASNPWRTATGSGLPNSKNVRRSGF